MTEKYNFTYITLRVFISYTMALKSDKALTSFKRLIVSLPTLTLTNYLDQ